MVRKRSPFVAGFFAQEAIERCRDGGVVADVSSEEIAEPQKGSDHLGVRRCRPLLGGSQLAGGHVDLTLGNVESQHIGGICGLGRPLGVELQFVVLHDLEDSEKRFLMVFPMLVVGKDSVNMYQEAFDVSK